MRVGHLLRCSGLLIDGIHCGWHVRQDARQVGEKSADQEGPDRLEEVAGEQRGAIRRGAGLGSEDGTAERDGGERHTVVVVVAGAVTADEQLRLAFQVDEREARVGIAKAERVSQGGGALQIDGQSMWPRRACRRRQLAR